MTWCVNLLADVAATATSPKAPPVPHPILQFLHWSAQEVDVHGLLQSNGWTAWLSLLVVIFIGLLLAKLLAAVVRRLAVRLEGGHWHVEALLLDGLINPIKLVIFGIFLGIGLHQLTLDSTLESVSYRVVFLLIDVAAFWYFFNIVTVVEHGLNRTLAGHQSNFTAQFVPLVRKTLRVFIFVVGALFILQNVFSQNIGAWLAGLGIAGLAVSLAAQDSLKNLFGTLTIFLDRPFLVGHWINYQSYSGTVTEIGLRSTWLRLFDGSMVSIPNSDIVNHAVQNYANRPYMRRTLNVTIPYDTPAPKIRQAVEIIKEIFRHPDFQSHIHFPHAPDTNLPRAFFADFGDTALNIVAYYYYHPGGDWWGYMDFNERFNHALFEAYEKAGIEFAFPTQTLYLAGDPKRKLAMEMLRPPVPGQGS